MPTEKTQTKEQFKALLWEKKRKNIRCLVCHRHCLIAEGKTGYCRVRKNKNGELIALNYGKTMGLPIDPIEKKPLFHFKPGSHCTGVSTYGCNFRCQHCQNYDLSMEWTEQMLEKVPFTAPKTIVDLTLKNNAQGIAYTYTEPTIFTEYALDTMKQAHKFGLYNVWVSNGYMSDDTLKLIKPYLDGINVDLKGNKKFYKEVCGNVDIEKVKENIAWLHKNKVHVEVTNLIIPGFNDSKEDFEEVSDFILSLSEEIPLHFTRFFPAYKMADKRPTDVNVLKQAKEVADKKGLQYVYVGNVPEEENSFCPHCRALLVKRFGFLPEIIELEGDKCGKCGKKLNFVP